MVSMTMTKHDSLQSAKVYFEGSEIMADGNLGTTAIKKYSVFLGTGKQLDK